MSAISGLRYACIIILTLLYTTLSAQKPAQAPKPLPPLSVGRNDELIYQPDAMGNRVLDFSYCGYLASEQPIPDVPVKVVVPLKNGDATLRIQSALDYVASLPAGTDGIKGAVLLQKGTYEVAGQLLLRSSGVVMRGSGAGKDGTILLGSGTDRQTLIRILGTPDKSIGKESKITDLFVPVNASTVTVADASAFKTGDKLILHRPSTKKWIDSLGTGHFGGGITALGWKPGERDIYWDRTVVSVEGSKLHLDAPITTALDTSYGGALVAPYNWPGRISQVGIENLTLRSAFDINNPKDEAHRWMAVTLENVRDSWVRQLNFEHFAGSAVDVLETASRITVEDCKSLAPVSEIAAQRRQTFITTGQQTLFQRCYAENGYYDFATGFCAPGPNAFVQCQSIQPYNFSGAIDSWSSGILFDVVNVDGQALRFGNRGQDGQGAGWTAANSVFWQCTAARVDCYRPPTANNYAFAIWAQFSGDGFWAESNNSVHPRSLYYEQLHERLRRDVSAQAQIMPMETDASSSPSVEVAAKLTANSVEPAPQLKDWIDGAARRHPVQVNAAGVKTIDQIGISKQPVLTAAAAMQIRNGWLVRGDQVVTGRRQEVPWWNGSVLPTDLPKMKAHITRFVPGRTGLGLTDDLDSLTDDMKRTNLVGLEHNYALWYERRRDDHERIRRMDGEVWPPFYEVPFARTGSTSLGWDGLSRYDLTKYNKWYWSRLKQFADLADRKGLVLVHQNYFQHNIIEAGAHYADFPWRPVNNVNNTGFPEPVPYAGDKRLFMAEQFYDETNPVRRPLHIAYIRKCLDNFKDNTGVIQLIGAEFTGPRHFAQFWLDAVRDWEKDNKKKEIIGLSVTKDVQDSMLAVPANLNVIDLIDIRFWHYQGDGTTYEPKGGQNLAPRQHARLLKPKASSFEQVYRAVKEYRLKFPGKAVMYSGDGYDQFGWAAFMAGGSLASLPKLDETFLAAASLMQPVDGAAKQTGQFGLANGTKGWILYLASAGTARPQLPASAKGYRVRYIDPRTGSLDAKEDTIQDAGGIRSQQSGPVVVWITPL